MRSPLSKTHVQVLQTTQSASVATTAQPGAPVPWAAR